MPHALDVSCGAVLYNLNARDNSNLLTFAIDLFAEISALNANYL
jgi:hypothetical protein